MSLLKSRGGSFAGGGDMHHGILDDDIAEYVVIILADVFVVIAGHIDNVGIVSGLAKDLLDDGVVRLRPIHLF
jgi:hypothetical protein